MGSTNFQLKHWKYALEKVAEVVVFSTTFLLQLGGLEPGIFENSATKIIFNFFDLILKLKIYILALIIDNFQNWVRVKKGSFFPHDLTSSSKYILFKILFAI